MKAYTEFAQVYDEFMDNIPYDEWTEYVLKLLQYNNALPQSDTNKIVELGCGTGTVSRMLANIGYNVTGIDISQEMLDIANSKNNKQADVYVTYDNQDMRYFKIDYKADAIISICDSINYLLNENDLESAFISVKNALVSGGVFIFDMKTQYFYQEVLDDNVFADNREDASYIWENHYDAIKSVNEYKLTLYIKDNQDIIKRNDDDFNDNNYYTRYEEIHNQRAYTIKNVIRILKNVGADKIKVYNAFTMKRPSKKSERVYFVVKF